MKSVALLLGWLALIAFPRFAIGRVIPVNTCVANLTQIDGAVQQWVLERKLSATNTYSFADPTLMPYFKGSKLPICPSGGKYHPAATVAGAPKCSIHGRRDHPIDAERALQRDADRSNTALAMVVALCSLFTLLLATQASERTRLACSLAVGLLSVGLVFRCLNETVGDSQHKFPAAATLLYAATGTFAFVLLRHERTPWVRVLAFAGTGLLGAFSLLLLLIVGLTRFSKMD